MCSDIHVMYKESVGKRYIFREINKEGDENNHVCV